MIDLRTALAGRYDIERELGRGGMATVYLARDVRHGRHVAVKVLDPELAASVGSDRFLSEIAVTAKLQHPNILSLFDSGDASGLLYYVMPYADGETLRHRLERERQLPVPEALRIATGIAAALEHAHRNGIVHRDLKPENILLTDGEPIVADFGIALALSRAASERYTLTGLSLGTPAYMSPEQATSDRVIDARSDIFSLGVMLYEMLAGESPFAAPTAQGTIARILTETPRPIARASIPANVVAALSKALEKLPADRWSSAREFAGALSDTRLLNMPAKRGNRALVAGAVVVIAAVALLIYLQRPKAMIEERGITLRFPFVTTDSARFNPITPGIPFAISRDERRVVYVGAAPGIGAKLYVKGLDDMQTHVLEGTDRALAPTFSPDGRWIAFVADSRIVKTQADGGPLVTILAANPLAVAGLDWASQDTIIASVNGSLLALPASGGPPVTLSQPDTAHGERQQWGPHPIGDRFIAYVSVTVEGTSTNRIGILDRRTGKATITNIRATTVLGAVDGRLLWVTTTGRVMAAPIDGSGAIGNPTLVLEDVLVRPGGAAKAAMSAEGSLIYQRGLSVSNLVVVDDKGTATLLGVEPLAYAHPRWSPDASRIAVTVVRPGTADLWVIDAKSRVPTRITSGNAIVGQPEWTPDGKRILYRLARPTGTTLQVQAADGSSPPETLIDVGLDPYSGAMTRDGKWLVFRTGDLPKHPRDIMYAALSGDRTPRPLIATDALEMTPQLSPDERWFAYASDESGRFEIYVRRFPGAEARVQVSVGGGGEPRWSKDGRTIFYRAGRSMMAAEVTVSPSFAVTSRTQLFDGPFLGDVGFSNYDLTPDGKHFLMLQSVDRQVETIMIYGWANELRQTWKKR